MSVRDDQLASPFGPTPLSHKAAEDLAWVMKAIADPSRLMMLSLLRHHGRDGLHVVQITELVGSLAQPTVSHHLRVLTQAGWIDRTKQGPYANYRLNRDRARAVAAVLKPPGGRK